MASPWKTLGHLSDLRVWTWNARADPSWLEHLRTHLSELTSYLDANADSLPNHGARYRARAPISTAFVRSTAADDVKTHTTKVSVEWARAGMMCTGWWREHFGGTGPS
jgi:hypothetical protein